MFLIIFLGLMAKLASVSSDCDIGYHVKNFDYFKVGVSVLTRFLEQGAVKTAAWALYYS
jgi:hypothetical protein